MTGLSKSFLLVFLLAPLTLCEARLTYATIGPMIHVNFGDGRRVVSYAVEAALWNFPGKSGQAGPSGAGIGWSFGWEWEPEGYRIYTEPQIGVVAAGASLGPVLQVREKEGVSFGWQGSLWVNALLGADMRYRRIGSERWFAPGGYLKIPVELDDETR